MLSDQQRIYFPIASTERRNETCSLPPYCCCPFRKQKEAGRLGLFITEITKYMHKKTYSACLLPLQKRTSYRAATVCYKTALCSWELEVSHNHADILNTAGLLVRRRVYGRRIFYLHPVHFGFSVPVQRELLWRPAKPWRMVHKFDNRYFYYGIANTGCNALMMRITICSEQCPVDSVSPTASSDAR